MLGLTVLYVLAVGVLVSLLGAVAFIVSEALKIKKQQSNPTFPKEKYPYIEPKFPGGNIDDMADFRGYWKKILAMAPDQNSPIASAWVFGEQALCVARHDHVAAILHSSVYRSGMWMLRQHATAFFGKGLVNIYNDEWKMSRKILVKMFHNKAMRGFAEDMAETSRQLNTLLDSKLDRQIDVISTLRRATFNVIGRAGFGVDFNSVLGNMPPEFDAFSFMQEEYTRRPKSLKPWDFFYWLPSENNSKHRAARKVIEDRVESLISTRLKEKAELEKEGKQYEVKNDVLDFLVFNKDAKFDRESIVGEILTMLFAGYDTSSTAMTYAIYSLSQNPDVEKKMVEEIDRVFDEVGEENLGYDNAQDLLPYTQQVIKEAMRLFPPVPFTARTLTRDLDLDGVVYPKDTYFILPMFEIHYSKLNWGEDADKFRPERFAEGLKEDGRWIPFSGGPRNCLGYRFALLEMVLLISSVYRRYHFEVSSDYVMETKANGALQEPNAPLVATVRARTGEAH